jgi:hypothetical protein
MKKFFSLQGFFVKPVIGLLICTLLGPLNSSAQQLRIFDFAIFGGNGTCPNGQTLSSPQCAVQLGSATFVNGGSVGSYRLVKSTGNINIAGNIHSGGTIELANGNSVSGKITAANSQGLSINTTILLVGSNATFGGNIDVKGKIVIGGGVVSGKVTHPPGTSYSGPTPAGGNVTAAPSLPTLPTMPAISNFPDYGTTDITSTTPIIPGAYRNLTLGGNKTITLSGPGVYTFKSIKNSGNTNSFVFDFQNSSTGTFIIYVHGDVDLNKVNATMINGGSASRIFAETHGTGSTNPDPTVAWNIANGASGNSASKWLGVGLGPLCCYQCWFRNWL